MKKISKPLIFSLVFTLIVLSVFLLNKPKKTSVKRNIAATVGEDDRFYVRNSKWAELFSGSVKINFTGLLGGLIPFDTHCSGSLIEGDIIVTASHCLGTVLNEDEFIDLEELASMKIYFDDANLNDSTITAPDKMAYSVKDIFSGANYGGCTEETLRLDFVKDDFAFIKLNEPIPKKYKRFKMLKDINLNEYEILGEKFQKGLSVSTVGYPGDAKEEQKLAHIGCRIRDSKQHKGVWLLQTDCDISGGASGSSLFKILKHKKTGEIELGVLGVLSTSKISFLKSRGFVDDFNYSLGAGAQYHLDSYPVHEGQYSMWVSLNSHSLFNKTLQKFKKDSSQWRTYKAPPLKKHNVLDINFLKKKLKSLNEEQLKNYLKSLKKEKLLKLENCIDSSTLVHLVNLKELSFLENKKQKILEQFVENIKIEIKGKAKKYFNNRRKSLSYKNTMKAYGVSLLEEDDLSSPSRFKKYFEIETPYEDPIKNKEQSDKKWNDYFGE